MHKAPMRENDARHRSTSNEILHPASLKKYTRPVSSAEIDVDTAKSLGREWRSVSAAIAYTVGHNASRNKSVENFSHKRICSMDNSGDTIGRAQIHQKSAHHTASGSSVARLFATAQS